jgi:hypothetical protein
MHFPGEFIEPVADFGGGSGIGAVWIDEPGIPARWNNAPFTADYGRTALFHHQLERRGATYVLPTGPAGPGDINGPGNQPFLRAPNPVDADIDARSTIYFTT